MNKKELDILVALRNEPFENQRILAQRVGLSVGATNMALNQLADQDLLDGDMQLTAAAQKLLDDAKPVGAVILAAGFGMRMVPINTQAPKALVEVHGEPLIERQIRQLHQAGIHRIYVIVGFMKEQFEYLIDQFGVELIVNTQYASKNNLHSLALASAHLSDAYIVPCDIWCKENPFSDCEPYSWYMLTQEESTDSTVRINRKWEPVAVANHQTGNRMVGISYLTARDAVPLVKRLMALDGDSRYDNAFWEEALMDGDRMCVSAKVVEGESCVEINTYEQLRELDGASDNLKSDAITVIARALHAEEKDIQSIEVLKKGMTNRSFLFCCKGRKYIMRIPGEGTDQLINRRQEADVYRALAGKGLCDDPVYINPENGYKITAFLEGVRVCDCESREDLEICMKKLKQFHDMELQVAHTFDIFGQIEFYESLWNGAKSVFRDYEKTKQQVLSLRSYIEAHCDRVCLTHIDAVPDNFLFYDGGLQLTDWEYAGMQDPHVDIAMFCIYSLYSRQQIDRLIDIYFAGKCTKEIRCKIYCYVACCGLLWSNWCEYKRSLGVEFGEYALRQYRYAKDFYRILQEEWGK